MRYEKKVFESILGLASKYISKFTYISHFADSNDNFNSEYIPIFSTSKMIRSVIDNNSFSTNTEQGQPDTGIWTNSFFKYVFPPNKKGDSSNRTWVV